MIPPTGPTLTNLSNCDREPIHTPGSIQPHGFLFVLTPADWLIVAASANVRDLFWREPTALIGSPIAALLGDEVVPALERVRASPDFAQRVLFVRHVTLDHEGEPRPFGLVAHGNGDTVILEGEQLEPAPPLQIEQDLQTFLDRLAVTESVEEVQQLAVAEVRRITGFDRCLLYRFDADWNGTVIAEDRNHVLPAYLHQRFPAADIPRPARELYRRNRLRLIPTNTYRPVPIISRVRSAPGSTLDLSLAVLRSVSPIHLEYMRNMGTGSSMSISVLRGGELWGLISCHSLAPRFVPFDTRSACELLGQFLGQHLAAREQARDLAARVELTTVMTRLLGEMAQADDFAELSDSAADSLRHLAHASGAAIVRGDAVALYGRTPPAAATAALARWAAAQGKDLLFWDRVAEAFPEAGAFAEVASGVLVLTVPGPRPVALLWFRPEIIHVIEWGGEPRKAIEAAGEGHALHPRKSFETWRETVRGRSQPWEPPVTATVRELHRLLVALRLTERGAAA